MKQKKRMKEGLIPTEPITNGGVGGSAGISNLGGVSSGSNSPTSAHSNSDITIAPLSNENSQEMSPSATDHWLLSKYISEVLIRYGQSN